MQEKDKPREGDLGKKDDLGREVGKQGGLPEKDIPKKDWEKKEETPKI